MSTLILIRGLPGSGKSTLAKSLYNWLLWPTKHHEADDFHVHDGVYQWRPEYVKKAHLYCQQDTEESLKKDWHAIVSNTFTTRKEMQPYFDLAKKYKAIVQVIECHGNFGSIHNVPEATMLKMAERWEPFNTGWLL